MKFSNRILKLNESPIRKLYPYAYAAEARGKKVYYLNIGQPDLPTPSCFHDAIKSYQKDTVSYSPTRGESSLLKSVINYYKANSIDLSTDHLLVTNGGSEALLFALSILCDAGDEVLIPEPFYVNTGFFINQLDIKKVTIHTEEKSGYHLPSIQDIEKLVTDKTRAIIITNPNNPTGTMYSYEEINRIKEVALKNNLFIIADEVYSKITFTNEPFYSFGQLKGLENNLIIVDSVSKRYSACGARIGMLISKNKEFMAQAMKLAASRLSVSTFNQVGASALYEIENEYFKGVKNEYLNRRNAVIEELQKIEHISFHNPEGAFYMLITLPFKDADHFAKWALEAFEYEGQTVFVAPAQDFYENENRGKNQVRLAFIYEEHTIRQAVFILGKAISTYLNRPIIER